MDALAIGGDCFVRSADRSQKMPHSGQAAAAVRIQSQRGFEGFDRLVMAARPGQHIAEQSVRKW